MLGQKIAGPIIAQPPAFKISIEFRSTFIVYAIWFRCLWLRKMEVVGPSTDGPDQDLERSEDASLEDARSTETINEDDIEAGGVVTPEARDGALEEAFTLQALFPTVARLIGSFSRQASSKYSTSFSKFWPGYLLCAHM